MSNTINDLKPIYNIKYKCDNKYNDNKYNDNKYNDKYNHILDNSVSNDILYREIMKI